MSNLLPIRIFQSFIWSFTIRWWPMSRHSRRTLQPRAFRRRLPYRVSQGCASSPTIAATEQSDAETGACERSHSRSPDPARPARPLPMAEVQRGAPPRAGARLRPAACVRHRARTTVTRGHLRLQLHWGFTNKRTVLHVVENGHIELTDRNLNFDDILISLHSPIAPRCFSTWCPCRCSRLSH